MSANKDIPISDAAKAASIDAGNKLQVASILDELEGLLKPTPLPPSDMNRIKNPAGGGSKKGSGKG